MRRLAPILLLLVACSGPKPKPEPPSRAERWTADRSVIRALRDFLYAGYDLRLASDRPDEARDIAGLEERLVLSRDGLRNTLRESGADAAGLDDDSGLLREVHAGIRRGGRYAIIFGADEDSFALARVSDADLERDLLLFGKVHRYQLTVFDELLILDYPSYRSERLGLPSSRQTATYARNRTVRVDRSSAAQVGEKLFLPNVKTLKETARLAADDASFLALTKRPLSDMLTLTKGALRWRSLEPLWSMIKTRSRTEQIRRFADDYAERAELRAVAEQREALLLAPDPEAALGDEQRVLLFELGTLSAMIHGEPLGQLADVLALAAVALKTKAKGPHMRAARQLVVEFAGRVRQGQTSVKADALAFARLSRLSPDDLRLLAKAIYRARTS